ncbi:MAG: glycosyltransferase family 61 protein [Chitinophagaceae bacterium]|nr:glycosyltransferase family 61 protein [Chitinophagaceae bacterium]MCW5904894.1 glycosyltransferase family 61 protein [Chitinophagaceae bacterium]
MKLFLYKMYISVNNFLSNCFKVEDWRDINVLKKYNVIKIKPSFTYTLKGVNYHYDNKFVPDWYNVLESPITQPDVWYFVFPKVTLIGKGVILHKKNTVLLESTFFQREYLNKLKIVKLLIKNIFIQPKEEVHNIIPLMNRLCNNYFHWTAESLTRIALLTQHNPSVKEKFTILINHDAPKFVEESLELIIQWPKEKIKRYSDKKITKAFNCLQISYPTVRNQHTLRYYAYPAYIFQILSTLATENLQHLSHEEELPKKFIISRKYAGSRHLINEEILLEHFPNLNLQIIYLEKLPFITQVKLFNNAQLIIAPHGAGLTNLTYCRDTAVVYEIYPIGRNFNQNSSFYQISKSINLPYHLIMVNPLNEKEDMIVDNELVNELSILNKQYSFI